VSTSPVTIYLDQNHWICLARAAHGRPGGEGFRETLEALRLATSRDWVRLPISWFHFLETEQNAHLERRRRLAHTMTELGRCVTIAPLQTLVPERLVRSVARAYGIVRVPRRLDVLGVGMSHALGQLPSSPWEGLPIFHESILTAYPTGLTDEQLAASAAAIGALRKRDTDRAYLQERGRQWARTAGRTALRRYHLARCAIDWREDLNRAFQECALLPIKGSEGEQSLLTEIILAVPELRVRVELGELRDRQFQRSVKSNDFRDIDALAAAIPNCDVVVTEKFWAALAIQARLDRHFSTRVISDVREVPSILRDLDKGG